MIISKYCVFLDYVLVIAFLYFKKINLGSYIQCKTRLFCNSWLNVTTPSYLKSYRNESSVMVYVLIFNSW